MPDHDYIYMQQAETYHRLISKQADLLPHIEAIRPIHGLDIVDLGAGTGRLTVELAAQAQSVIALDASEAMLRLIADRLKEAGLTNVRTQVADLRKLPLPDHSADLIVAGWSICYVASRNVPDWQLNLEQVINEIKRVLRFKGTIIIFETMGTGFETPTPPDFLTSYYAELAQRYGFSHTWLRTDYQFDHIEQAESLTRFFFDDTLADRVVQQNLVRLPECAGVWWLHTE
ncbi:class I SAM-dependent methyltransferase [Paenibacillus agricola]|uniref:Class I SAM-dependent methyltransferase n=1 Tax=Paenibacillus agricola TaxID=2716264 RepID=A0ABX0JE25_9BACL|nr:class I SAM-dependent methyltransferase [Paenibacillus agricola]NHN32141.1 class I SAM-dependent methyltransferase [Paenibacillus agricola]